jgi:hypothetical protein
MSRKHSHYFKDCKHLQGQVIVPSDVCNLFGIARDDIRSGVIKQLLGLNKHCTYNPYEEVDVYAILDMFNVTNSEIAHAIKKLLVAGGRGYKDIKKDLCEVVDTLERHLEKLEETQKLYYDFVIRVEREYGFWEDFEGGKFLDFEFKVYPDKNEQHDAYVLKVTEILNTLEEYIDSNPNTKSESTELPNIPIGPVRSPQPLPPELTPDQINEVKKKIALSKRF